jgi:hypothetical protein
VGTLPARIPARDTSRAPGRGQALGPTDDGSCDSGTWRSILEEDGIEARIAGVDGPSSDAALFQADEVERHGEADQAAMVEDRRERRGTGDGEKIRGTAEKIRGGTAEKIRGTAEKIRGDGREIRVKPSWPSGQSAGWVLQAEGGLSPVDGRGSGR